jgi:phenylpropionate dioxygenase-like ring-hydroxylating dioxygenase large terminal subunit
MYPLKVDQPWPVNQWYIAGFSSEVEDKLLARTFLNKRVILFRDPSGVAHALSGICPHRMMPLELGSLAADRVTCGYHGLEFDFSGQCVASPTSVTPPACALKTYPLREVGPLLWIWVGDAALAQTTPLPPQESVGVGVDGWTTQCVDYGLLKARYTLLVDNLFDLSHVAFIHRSLFGDSAEVSLGKAKIDNREGRLAVVREMVDAPADMLQRFNHPGSEDRMAMELNTIMIGLSLISAGDRRWNGPTKDSPELGSHNFLHMLTPETDSTSHYWVGITRTFRHNDEQFDEWWEKMLVAVVQQDRDALEAIESLLQANKNIPSEISMISDAGALQARRLILQMIRDDNRQLESAA